MIARPNLGSTGTRVFLRLQLQQPCITLQDFDMQRLLPWTVVHCDIIDEDTTEPLLDLVTDIAFFYEVATEAQRLQMLTVTVKKLNYKASSLDSLRVQSMCGSYTLNSELVEDMLMLQSSDESAGSDIEAMNAMRELPEKRPSARALAKRKAVASTPGSVAEEEEKEGKEDEDPLEEEGEEEEEEEEDEGGPRQTSTWQRGTAPGLIGAKWG